MGNYLEPSGGDDTGRILAAIAALPRGGVIDFGTGDFQISQKIDLGVGIRLRGRGGIQEVLMGRPSPTALRWIGAAGVQAMFAFVNHAGSGLEDLFIDGSNRLQSGCVLYGHVGGVFMAHFGNFTGTGLVLAASPSSNTMHNRIEGSVHQAQSGVSLDGNGACNCCMNSFFGFDVQRVTEIGWYLGDCDNNRFYGPLSPGYLEDDVPGARIGFLITDPNKARANYFYHVQGGSRRNASNPAISAGSHAFFIQNARKALLQNPGFISKIYGYDRTNGEGPIETDSGEPFTNFVQLFG